MTEIAKHWIDGEWVGSGPVSESVNPATGALLGRWSDGGEAEAARLPAARSRPALVSGPQPAPLGPESQRRLLDRPDRAGAEPFQV